MNTNRALTPGLGSNPGRRLKLGYWIVYGAILLSLSLCFLYLGSMGWPGLHWDASLYGTPVINVASGKGWRFGSLGMQMIQRDNFAYDYHGFLHVFVYGIVFNSNSWAAYISSQSVVNAITFVAYTCAYLAHLRRAHGSTILVLVSSLLLGVIPGVICIGLQGRPEQLAPLILLIPMIVLSTTARAVKVVVGLGITLALLITLSPLLGLFFATFVAFYLYATGKDGPLASLRMFAACLFLAVLVSFLLISTTTPFSPITWYMNVARASKVALSFEGSLLFLNRGKWGISLLAPLWNVLALSSLCFGLIWLWRKKHNLASVLVAMVIFSYFNEKMIDYGYAPFIPFSIALGLLSPNRLVTAARIHPSFKIVRLFYLVAGSMYLYVLVAYVGLSFVLPSQQLSLIKARREFAQTAAGRALSLNNSAVGFAGVTNPSFVVFGEADTRYIAVTPTLSPSLDKSADVLEKKIALPIQYLVYPQTSTKMIMHSPPDQLFLGAKQYNLLESKWGIPSRFDMTLRPSTITNRYSYAIYRRQEAQKTTEGLVGPRG